MACQAEFIDLGVRIFARGVRFFSIEFALKIVETARMVPGRGPTCLACRAELIGIGVRILSEVFVKYSFSVRLVFGFYQDPHLSVKEFECSKYKRRAQTSKSYRYYRVTSFECEFSKNISIFNFGFHKKRPRQALRFHFSVSTKR